jgi:hypothetical protein
VLFHEILAENDIHSLEKRGQKPNRSVEGTDRCVHRQAYVHNPCNRNRFPSRRGHSSDIRKRVVSTLKSQQVRQRRSHKGVRSARVEESPTELPLDPRAEDQQELIFRESSSPEKTA